MELAVELRYLLALSPTMAQKTSSVFRSCRGYSICTYTWPDTSQKGHAGVKDWTTRPIKN